VSATTSKKYENDPAMSFVSVNVLPRIAVKFALTALVTEPVVVTLATVSVVGSKYDVLANVRAMNSDDVGTGSSTLPIQLSLDAGLPPAWTYTI
jgi:hypothetical protein